MITVHDLHEAIAECEGERNPNANTCIKLAAYYTILNHMEGDTATTDIPVYAGYSGSNEGVVLDSDTEFAHAVNGRDQGKMWALMDELMTAVSVYNPRLYDSVMQKIIDRG